MAVCVGLPCLFFAQFLARWLRLGLALLEAWMGNRCDGPLFNSPASRSGTLLAALDLREKCGRSVVSASHPLYAVATGPGLTSFLPLGDHVRVITEVEARCDDFCSRVGCNIALALSSFNQRLDHG